MKLQNPICPLAKPSAQNTSKTVTLQPPPSPAILCHFHTTGAADREVIPAVLPILNVANFRGGSQVRKCTCRDSNTDKKGGGEREQKKGGVLKKKAYPSSSAV